MKKETVLHRLLIANEEMFAMMICNLMMTKNVNALKLMKKETVLHRLLIANEEMCATMICNLMMTKNVNALKLMKKETVLHRLLIAREECECIEADEEGNCVAQTADRKRRM